MAPSQVEDEHQGHEYDDYDDEDDDGEGCRRMSQSMSQGTSRSRSVSRRDVLRGAGTVTVAAGAGLVSACGEGSPGAAENAEALGSATPGTVVATLADVPVGGAVSTTIDDVPVLVTQPTEGEVHVFSAVCTHQGCDVLAGDGELRCPCHQSRFSLSDASVLGGPAPEPLAEVSVTVVDGDVVVS